MYKHNLYYLVCIILLFTTVFGLTKDEVLKLDSGNYYCKDDFCVSTNDSKDHDIVIIPNKEGKNSTYIIDTCSITDIDLELCSSKKCTMDSECLSNKCVKNHCAFNEANPIVECQYVRTVHDNPIFGDPKGYRMQCGLPSGDICKSNDDCSSYNCEKYNNKSICGFPDDSGCHSACDAGTIPIILVIAIIFVILLCFCCLCVCCAKIK